MERIRFFVAITTCVAIFLTPALAAQQNGVLLPPPLKRGSSSSVPVPTTGNSVGNPALSAAGQPRMTPYEDWIHRCTDISLGEKSFTQCELLQAQQRQQGEEMHNVLILAFAEVAPEKEGKKPQLLLTSLVPLDVFLPVGIHFFADSRELVHIPFRHCNISGCWSQIILDENILDILKKGKEGLARFTIMNGQEVEIEFSLRGLTSGLKALRQADGGLALHD